MLHTDADGIPLFRLDVLLRYVRIDVDVAASDAASVRMLCDPYTSSSRREPGLWQESAGALSQRRHAVNAAALVRCQRGYLAVLAVRNVRDHNLKCTHFQRCGLFYEWD